MVVNPFILLWIYQIKLGQRKNSPPVDKGIFQQLVEKLIHLSHTRLDINFVVSVASQFMNNTTEENLEAIYIILQHLKMT